MKLLCVAVVVVLFSALSGATDVQLYPSLEPTSVDTFNHVVASFGLSNAREVSWGDMTFNDHHRPRANLLVRIFGVDEEMPKPFGEKAMLWHSERMLKLTDSLFRLFGPTSAEMHFTGGEIVLTTGPFIKTISQVSMKELIEFVSLSEEEAVHSNEKWMKDTLEELRGALSILAFVKEHRDWSQDHHPDFYEATFVSARTVRDTFGPESEEFTVVQDIVVRFVTRFTQAMAKEYGNKLLAEVLFDVSGEPVFHDVMVKDLGAILGVEATDSSWPWVAYVSKPYHEVVMWQLGLWTAVVLVIVIAVCGFVLGGMDYTKDTLLFRTGSGK